MQSEPTGQSQLDESMRNAYLYFVEALATLAAEPEAQCDAMGDYNVGWEIKHDVAAGRHLTDWGRLTLHQRDAIESLVAALEAVPQDALKSAQGRSANLEAMRNRTWTPLRKHAAELLSTLRPPTESNARCFTNGG